MRARKYGERHYYHEPATNVTEVREARALPNARSRDARTCANARRYLFLSFSFPPRPPRLPPPLPSVHGGSAFSLTVRASIGPRFAFSIFRRFPWQFSCKFQRQNSRRDEGRAGNPGRCASDRARRRDTSIPRVRAPALPV